MGGSGGGVSGEVSFPAYIETLHEDWIYGAGPSALSTTVEDTMDTAFGADPYAAYSFVDPTTALAAVQTRFDTWFSAVSASATTTDFNAIIDQAQLKADECDIDGAIDVRTIINRSIGLSSDTLEEAIQTAQALVDQNVIEGLVDAFESEQSRTREKRIGNFSSQMAGFGALRGSSYLIGLGQIYAEEQEATSRFQNQISSQMFQQGIQAWMTSYQNNLRADLGVQTVNKEARQRTLTTATQLMQRMRSERFSWLNESVRTLAETKRIDIVARREHDIAELDLDVKSALWDLDIFGRGMSIVGGLSGYAHPLPEGPSKAASVLGGAMAGAGAGAAVGTALGGPGIGTAVGALVGGIAGLF